VRLPPSFVKRRIRIKTDGSNGLLYSFFSFSSGSLEQLPLPWFAAEAAKGAIVDNKIIVDS
jgi:hypothetical protein